MVDNILKIAILNDVLDSCLTEFSGKDIDNKSLQDSINNLKEKTGELTSVLDSILGDSNADNFSDFYDECGKNISSVIDQAIKNIL